jgi:phage regulator Rha-like protein
MHRRTYQRLLRQLIEAENEAAALLRADRERWAQEMAEMVDVLAELGEDQCIDLTKRKPRPS